MAKWVPPIPTEKLYSAPAMKLGAGLALLVWCYDGIERDGTVKIELEKAASALGKPYRTVKEWWHLLRDGPFFSNIRDRGKLGFVVTFDREWVEWRVMASNYPTEDNGQRHSDVLEDIPTDVQSPVKVASKSDERHPDGLETTAYKVLITTDQNIDSCPVSDDTDAPQVEAPKAKSKSSPNRSPKVKAAAPAAPPSDHKRLMQEYADILGYPLPNGGKEAAGAAMLLKAGYTVEQVVSVYCEMKADKFWAGKHLSLHNVHQQIGAILNQQQARQRAAIERVNGLNGRHHVAELDDGEYASPEEIEAYMAGRRGGGK